MNTLQGLYHADKLDEQSFIDNFTIRLKEFQQIMDTLRDQQTKPLQHFLITGKRGMGKSTLLRRIFIEVQNTSLKDKMFCVRLGTEQYRLSRLYKLWEMVIENLATQVPELEQKRQEMEESKDYEEHLAPVIGDYLAATGKTLLLLIDNFDQFIDKITEKDRHALREALIQYPVQIIGNTVFYNEHFFSYNNPFFDFFKPIKLTNLSKDEAEDFIRDRARNEGIENFEEVFKTQKGKITALRILSGGVPRTLLILLSIISRNNTGDAVEYLHEMIELVTPLYQDRMKSLSPQQQEIMHHLAMQWDRTPVKELAAAMRIPSKSISAQLLQLENSGYINKVDIPGRNHYYEIDERFFNIWLLMSEAAPYDTKRVIWLTKWLDAFYSKDELMDFASFCNTGLKGEKPVNMFLIVQALSESEKLDYNYKKNLVKQTSEELKDKIAEVGIWEKNFNEKISRKETELRTLISKLLENKDYEKAIDKLDELMNFDEMIAFWMKGVVYHILAEYEKAEKNYIMAIEKGSTDAVMYIADLYKNSLNNIEKAEEYYLKAAEQGNVSAMSNLGDIYREIKKDTLRAEKFYLRAAELNDDNAMYRLGNYYLLEKYYVKKAEHFYLKSAEKGNTYSMVMLWLMYKKFEIDISKAENYLNRVLESQNEDAKLFLAAHLFSLNENEKKHLALDISIQSFITKKPEIDVQTIAYINILLWNEKVSEALAIVRVLFEQKPLHDSAIEILSQSLQYLLLFRQTASLKILLSDKKNKDRFKPIYYALMHEMKDQHPKEYLRMPEELKEPVEAILKFVKAERMKLGLGE
ncbi:MAG: AAA family ATPase [Bacteroidetes bacterium]|nr:AAA family ATPase [Bacteroidota bacterium]